MEKLRLQEAKAEVAKLVGLPGPAGIHVCRRLVEENRGLFATPGPGGRGRRDLLLTTTHLINEVIALLTGEPVDAVKNVERFASLRLEAIDRRTWPTATEPTRETQEFYDRAPEAMVANAGPLTVYLTLGQTLAGIVDAVAEGSPEYLSALESVVVEIAYQGQVPVAFIRGATPDIVYTVRFSSPRQLLRAGEVTTVRRAVSFGLPLLQGLANIWKRTLLETPSLPLLSPDPAPGSANTGNENGAPGRAPLPDQSSGKAPSQPAGTTNPEGRLGAPRSQGFRGSRAGDSSDLEGVAHGRSRSDSAYPGSP